MISALGTVVRMFVFRDLQIGHLSKKQEVASEEASLDAFQEREAC